MDTSDSKKENINTKAQEVASKQETVEPEVRQVPAKMPVDSVLSKPTAVSVVVMVIVAIVVGLVAFTGALYLGETGTFSLFGGSEVSQNDEVKKALKKGSNPN